MDISTYTLIVLTSLTTPNVQPTYKVERVVGLTYQQCVDKKNTLMDTYKLRDGEIRIAKCEENVR